jgi:hypothetical protein
LGQQPLGKVKAFLKLCELHRLASQAVVGVFQRCGVLIQLLAELGKLGSRGSAPGYCPSYCPRDHYRRRGDHREGK